MNGIIAALGLTAALAGASLVRKGSSNSGLEPVSVKKRGEGFLEFDGMTVRGFVGDKDKVSAWRYGDNVLLLIRDEKRPRYIAVLYSGGEVDEDRWLEGDDLAWNLGDGYRKLSDAQVAEAMLGLMD